MDGKSANGSEWRGCPEGYKFVEKVGDDSGSDDEDTTGLKDQEVTIDDINDVDNTATKKDTDLVDGEGAVGGDGVPSGEQNQTDLDEDGLLQQLEAANLLLKKQAAVREQQMSIERGRRIAMLKAENSNLTKSMKGDIGGVKPRNGQAVVDLHPNPKNSKKSSNSVRIDLPSLQTQLTRNQLRDSEYRPEESSIYSGLDINGIRKIPVIRTEVERLIGKVKSNVPSLDSRPSFVLNKTPLPSSQHGKSGDPDTSSDEDVDDLPQAGYVFRWKRDQNGEKYFVEEKQEVVREDDTDLVLKYVRDEATGRSYKRLVLRTDPQKELTPQWVVDPRTGRQVQMLVPCQSGSSQQKSSQRSGSQHSGVAGTLGQHNDGQEDNFVTPLPPSARRKTPQLSSSAPSRFSDPQHEDKQG